jgi:hypothetical protein
VLGLVFVIVLLAAAPIGKDGASPRAPPASSLEPPAWTAVVARWYACTEVTHTPISTTAIKPRPRIAPRLVLTFLYLRP